MTRLTVLGGTGYTGSAIVREAVARGHEVTSYSRHAPAEPVPGVTYVQGSVLDADVRRQIVAGADVIVSALAPRGDMAGTQVEILSDLARQAKGTRIGVVGGFGSLRPEPGAPRFVDTDALPEEYKPESREMLEVKEALAAGDADWFYVSPAAAYGSYAPGEATGSYRTSGEIALFDADGKSELSGADFAKAIVDEIEKPQYQRAHWSVAY
ncbi:NAD(P)-dependent oxidoreductase [Symbioplanes lichenis]|uniref:NAD(P)-dependent oxidoreductase n=1 Tax=Symbioplanes lichenis TaxID=1629072 RepID=UPI0027391885|nr:NAD(P)H-binding protein [Actinoplanes lichenis]